MDPTAYDDQPLGFSAFILVAITILLILLGIAAANASEHTEHECDQAADMIERVAHAKEHGYTAIDAVSDFTFDIKSQEKYAPDERWFNHDDADIKLLLAAVLGVFKSALPPAILAAEFKTKCFPQREEE